MAIRSLRALTLAFLAVFLGATAATATAIYVATLHTVDRLVDQRLVRISDIIAPEGGRFDLSQARARVATAERRRETADLGFILRKDGRQVAGNVTLRRKLPSGFADVNVQDRIVGLTTGRAYSRDLGNGRSLTVIGETEPVDHFHIAHLRIYLIGFGSIIAIAVVATLVFSMIIRRRIVEMRRTVEAIIDGDLSRRVPTSGSRSEFDLQAEAFNRMLTQIGVLMEEVRNVSFGIAHELRTPLARLRNQLGMLAAESTDETVSQRAQHAIGEADGLLMMFSALLKIAEIESGTRRAEFMPVDLADTARQCLEALAPVIEDTGHRLAGTEIMEATVVGDRQLLTNMLVNLVENIIHHTPKGTGIWVTLRSEKDVVRLSVTDNGPGIALADHELALARFGRLNRTRSAGTGLGLALVDSIVRLHRGRLSLDDAEPGLRVSIELPAR